MTLRLHIYSRIGIALITIILLLLGHKTYLLITYLLLVAVIGVSGFLKEHLRLLIIGMFPVYLSFILIYVLILSQSGAWQEIHFRVLNLLILTTIFQIVLIFPPDELFYSLKKIGIKGSILIIVVSSYTLVDDISKRSEKIINARLSRGYVKKRTRFTMMKQLPYVLRPLFIQIFRSSYERAYNWEQKDMIGLIQKFNKVPSYNWLLNIVIIICFILWVLFVGLIVLFD